MAALAIAQPSVPTPLEPGTSAIRGTVTDALTKAPIVKCEIRVGQNSSGTFRSSTVTTGEDGTYELAGIADGSYNVWARCESYLPACIGARDSSLAPCAMTVLKDQQRSDLNFSLTPGAVARGRVVDGNGRPVSKATVRLGGPFVDRPLFLQRPATTKADGTFELTELPDGEWRLEVDAPPRADAPRTPVIYYPGVLTRDDAGLVELHAGRATANITITVPTILESTLTVRIPPPDATIPVVSVSLVRPSPLMSRSLELDADGRATVRGLTEGRYFVTATGRSEQQQWVAHEPIDFSGHPMEISLHLQPAGRIRGRIVTNRGGVPPLTESSVGAVWVDDDVALNPLTPEESPVAVDGTFEIHGLFGRRQLQLLRFDPDWRIDSVRQGRNDVTSGVDVVPNSTTDVTIIVRQR
jgi:hypothetical protein